MTKMGTENPFVELPSFDPAEAVMLSCSDMFFAFRLEVDRRNQMLDIRKVGIDDNSLAS